MTSKGIIAVHPEALAESVSDQVSPCFIKQEKDSDATIEGCDSRESRNSCSGDIPHCMHATDHLNECVKVEENDEITPTGDAVSSTDEAVSSELTEHAEGELEDELENISSNSTDKEEKPVRNTVSDFDANEMELIIVHPKGSSASTCRYECRICHKKAYMKHDAIKHVRIHTGSRPYKCATCGKAFSQGSALRCHEKCHSGHGWMTCELCNKTFALKERLRLHMLIHTGEKPHKCATCGTCFSRRSILIQHMKTHAVRKKHTCPVCKASFLNIHSCKEHVKTHLGLQKHQCDICNKKFAHKTSLLSHMKQIHGEDRSIVCPTCGKTFRGHFATHMKIHMNIRAYKCELCDSAFTQNSQLTVHMRVHTGERPYKCVICEATFSHSSAQKIHMRLHTGERPFRCLLCRGTAQFAQLPHLKKHMRCVHETDRPYVCTMCDSFYATLNELTAHESEAHDLKRSEGDDEGVTLSRLRRQLAIVLFKISSEECRRRFSYGKTLIDNVLQESLKSSGFSPSEDPKLGELERLRQNILLLFQWTVPKDVLCEYERGEATVDEVLTALAGE